MSEENKGRAEIRKFGTVLRRLAPKYLEAVRLWRNDPAISQWLVFQGQIGPEQQRKWFDSVDQSRNFYYIIEYQGQPVGMVNLKNYEAAAASAEGGIFIGDQSFQNSMVALDALLTMYDFGFEELGLKKISAYIKIDNIRAARLNQSLGFFKLAGQPAREDKTELWILEAQNYFKHTSKFRSYIFNKFM